MEVKKIVEGMTAPEVAKVIDDNFKAQNEILETDIKKQNNVIGVSEYKDFSESEAVSVGELRLKDGYLYECIEETTGEWDAAKWKSSSFKKETEKKLSELGSELESKITEVSEDVYLLEQITEKTVSNAIVLVDYDIHVGDKFLIYITNAEVGKDVSVGTIEQGQTSGFIDLFLSSDKKGSYKISVEAKVDADMLKLYSSSDNTLFTIYKVITSAKEEIVRVEQEFKETFNEEENIEFVSATIDRYGRLLKGIKKDGTHVFYGNVDAPNIKQLVSKDISDIIVKGESDEFVYLITDSIGSVLFGIKRNGEPYFGIELPTFVSNAIKNYLNDYSKYPIKFGGSGSKKYVVVGEGSDGAQADYCVAVGPNVLTKNTGIKNMVVGSDNLRDNSGNDNTSMGYHALFRNTSGSDNSAYGSEALDDNTTGHYNAALGFCAAQRNNSGSYNTAVGVFALRGGKEGTRYEEDNLKYFQRNTVVGAMSMQNAIHGTSGNVVLGSNSLQMERAYKNCIAIGNNVECPRDNTTVIGNEQTIETKVFGDLVVKGIDGINRRIVFNADGSCSWIEV